MANISQQLNDERPRCEWAGDDLLYCAYHDKEWGEPVHADRTLFEFLLLEGAQAGLSWLTILRRREGYRRAFAGFNPRTVSQFDDSDIDRLMNDEGIIRNKAKVLSAIRNAKVFLDIQLEFGSFDDYIWRFVNHKPILNHPASLLDVPASTELAVKISNDLKSRGMNFVGPTIIYAFMQAVGIVNDHVKSCFKSV